MSNIRRIIKRLCLEDRKFNEILEQMNKRDVVKYLTSEKSVSEFTEDDISEYIFASVEGSPSELEQAGKYLAKNGYEDKGDAFLLYSDPEGKFLMLDSGIVYEEDYTNSTEQRNAIRIVGMCDKDKMYRELVAHIRKSRYATRRYIYLRVSPNTGRVYLTYDW